MAGNHLHPISLERQHDGPIPETALWIWRHDSARAAERAHLESMVRLARDQVRSATRICRGWDEADPAGWRDDTVRRMRASARAELKGYWRAYRRDLARLRTRFPSPDGLRGRR